MRNGEFSIYHLIFLIFHLKSLIVKRFALSAQFGPAKLGRHLAELESGEMLPIKGLYEIAIRVKDLARAETFYKDVLGLKEGLRDNRRNWLFLYAGGDAGMVVLQEDKGEWPTQHFAFTVTEADIKQAAAMLREKGVTVSEPVYHEWMNSVSVYFDDPDGHALELLALSGS